MTPWAARLRPRQSSALFIFGFWLTALACVAQAPDNSACAACHEQAQKIQNTAHSSLACASCHVRHEQYPHPAGVAKPACESCHRQVAGAYNGGVHGRAARQGMAAPDCALCHGDAHGVQFARSSAFRRAVPDICGLCHEQIAAQYKESVHGKAVAQGIQAAPLCTDCHGEHSIQPHTAAASPVNARHIRDTCGRCHGDIRLATRFGLPSDRVVSFDATFHGLAAKGGSQTVANCASCHGVHNILPPSDPRSTISPKNLPATCGQCHPGAGTRFALGPIHQAGVEETTAVRWARQFYAVMIPVVIGLMLLHNAGDWARKLRQRLAGAPSTATRRTRSGPEIRMLPLERIEHAVLMSSFTVLAWSGFALKYPDSWWARVLVRWGASPETRGSIHRLAAALFLALALLHAGSLVFSSRLRRHWQELWPRAADAYEAWGQFLYNLGALSRQPAAAAHGYVEKIEYWALVWGGLVMAATGALLWANNITLAWLPKQVIDFASAVHFYEAILATLAIIVWHFYFVIFDPDVYPMDTAWLTGVSPRRRAENIDEETGADLAASTRVQGPP